MSLGFVLLAHGPVFRATQLAAHVARSGFPVMVHLDRRNPPADLARMRDATVGLPVFRASRRHRCDWGGWGIVAATRDAAAELLDSRPEIRHVYLISGACLPTRPLRDLADHLDRHPDTDFIESVALDAAPWSRGGGDAERFRFRYPLAFRHRARFDALTALQRRMGLVRRPPASLDGHLRLGAQWWCLTRRTLELIQSDPGRPAAERFFRSSWIPDESFFQTLARRHARRLESRALTFAAFDPRGVPRVFYDDHLDLLAGSEAFVARKAWPGADRLYGRFLSPRAPRRSSIRAPAPGIAAHLARLEADRAVGRPGLVMQSRCPAAEADAPRTAGRYAVLWGVTELLSDAEGWFARAADCTLHGHLFAPDRAQFAGAADVHAGGLPAGAAPRDRDPEAFLRNLVWATRGRPLAFRMGPADRHAILGFIAGDPNAHVSVVPGAWLVALWREDARRSLPPDMLLRRAAELRRREMEALETFRASWAKARLDCWTIRDVADDPGACLAPTLSGIAARGTTRGMSPPRVVPLSGLAAFARRLRDLGLPVDAVDITQAETARPSVASAEPRAAVGLVPSEAGRRAAAG